MSTHASPRPALIGLAGLTVALSGLAVVSTSAPATAASTGLVVNEVYGGGGATTGTPYSNADFVELYNPTDGPLPTNGLSLQYRSATFSTGSVGVLALPDETVPAHGHYLVQVSNGSVGPDLPVTPDHTGTSLSMSQSNGQVILAQGTTAITATGTSMHTVANVIDFVGYGSTPTSSETARTGTALTTTTAVQRKAPSTDTDNNSTDFGVPAAPSPTSSVVAGEELTATQPADVTATVGTPITPFSLAANGGTPPYTWSVTGLPDGVTATAAGEVSGTPTVAGAFPVDATVTDSSTTPATDEVAFTITVGTALEPTPIADIQGTGDASGMVGDTVLTKGVVTARYPTGNYNGMYIQTAGSGGATNATPGASDAIFVFGSHSMPAGVEIGDSVEVTGVVSEFFGTTEITPGSGGVVEVAALGTVTPRATVPGTDCTLPGTGCLTGASLSAAREAFEGELFQPTGAYTVTDVHDGSAFNGSSFSSSFFGEVGLAAESDMPLVTPTEVIDAQATADIAARKAYNDAHRMILDDGAGVTYWNTSNTAAMGQPLPWFTETNQVRVGASVTFPKPVVLEWRNSTWKLQPQTQVTDSGAERVAFEQDRPAQPEDVGGDLKLGTFNVLNYFTTLGVDYGGCSSFQDREGNPIAVSSCPGTGPRGAWDQASLDRQEAKIVSAINAMDADIMALEEIENSGRVDGGDRDEAVETLVAALNEDAGSARWAFVDSPTAVDPGEDVIRTAIIYNPRTVDLVGDSELFYDDAFSDAREPFAQTFKREDGADADGFAVIANHFKSKGSGTPDPDGQGNANDRRELQAAALAAFAEDFAASNGVEKIFLTGDFNAYSQEDPVQILYDAGYVGLESDDDPDEESYNFDGQIGSLDHVFANQAAAPDVTGVDIWTINSYESQYYEYSRFNYNIRQLYTPAPFRASDHNPELVGIDLPAPRLEATVTALHTPTKVRAGSTRAKLRVSVAAAGVVPTGSVQVTLPEGESLVGVLDDEGVAMFRLPLFASPGDHELTIEYSGDDLVADDVLAYTVRVVH